MLATPVRSGNARQVVNAVPVARRSVAIRAAGVRASVVRAVLPISDMCAARVTVRSIARRTGVAAPQTTVQIPAISAGKRFV